MRTAGETLRVEGRDGRWSLVGSGPDGVDEMNDFLGYLADRGYSPHTVRAYSFDLLVFARWLLGEGLAVSEVTTEELLRYLALCRTTPVPGRPGGNVYSIRDGRSAGYAATTINRRLAAVSGLFGYRGMRDPAAANPVPRRGEARRAANGERSGLLGTFAHRSDDPSCGSASRGGCLVGLTARRPPRCWAASAPSGIGRSPG